MFRCFNKSHKKYIYIYHLIFKDIITYIHLLYSIRIFGIRIFLCKDNTLTQKGSASQLILVFIDLSVRIFYLFP